MLRSSILVILLALIFTTTCNAQKGWRKGYIVDNSRDTTVGFIANRNSRSNSRMCFFKTQIDTEIRTMFPDQISGYRYEEGKRYKSSTIEINGTRVKVFIEFIFKGAVNLYHYNGGDQELFFIEKDYKLYELKNSRQFINSGNGVSVTESKEYIRILKYLLEEANLKKEIESSKLERSSLLSLVQRYHNEVSKTDEYEKFGNKQPVKIFFGPLFGLNNQTLILIPGQFYSMSNQTSGYGGMAFNIRNFSSPFQRFSFQVEVLANSYYMENRPKYSLNIPILLDLKLLNTKVFPKLEVGISNYVIRSGELKAQHKTMIMGVSLNYEYFKQRRIFVNVRAEKNPAILRFGAGVLF